ncbi:hypothetical protein P4S96_12225, partial [Aneurinibacillus thermoaerophilus]|uniref:hypothetical protein n=1 Tax=Aneurinibacillus thermoaerophilus TaxID=143495 RepID=UPI002E1F05AA|nr:hypothetical protein [Aneurinibacillus thermoaerophilus]
IEGFLLWNPCFARVSSVSSFQGTTLFLSLNLVSTYKNISLCKNMCKHFLEEFYTFFSKLFIPSS